MGRVVIIESPAPARRAAAMLGMVGTVWILRSLHSRQGWSGCWLEQGDVDHRWHAPVHLGHREPRGDPDAWGCRLGSSPSGASPDPPLRVNPLLGQVMTPTGIQLTRSIDSVADPRGAAEAFQGSDR